MHSVDVSVEVYGFCCQRCGHVWERTYEVHRSIDYKGDEIVAYYFGGRPATAPVWGGLSCPGCGGFRVRQSPQLHVARDGIVREGAVESSFIESKAAPA